MFLFNIQYFYSNLFLSVVKKTMDSIRFCICNLYLFRAKYAHMLNLDSVYLSGLEGAVGSSLFVKQNIGTYRVLLLGKEY